MRQIKEFIKRNYRLMLLFTALTLFSLYPYLNKLNISGHDLCYHVTRINEVYENLKQGQFPVLIHSNLIGSLGYANSLMYPELFLYIPAILKFMGFGTIASYKIFLGIITFVTFVTMYLTATKILKNDKIAIIVSILYNLSLYRLSDIFVRAALGEVIAMIFFPLLLYGLYDILYCERKKWWVLVLGIFGIANSHVLSFAFAIALIVVICLFNIIRIFKDRKIFLTLLGTAIISILSVVSIFLPMIEQYISVDFKVKDSNSGYILLEHAETLSMIFENQLKTGSSADGNVVSNGIMTMNSGLLLIIFPLLLIFKRQKDENKSRNKFIIVLTVIGFISLIMTTKLFPWNHFKILETIQFPWRINIIYTVVMTIVSGYSIYFVFKDKKEIFILIGILLILVSSKWLSEVNINELNFNYKELLEYSPVGNAEYLPANLNLAIDNSKVVDLDNSTDLKYEKNNIKIEVNLSQNIGTRIQIPYTYYKGYTAYVIDDEDNKHKLSVSENNGLVLVENNEKLQGKLTVVYKMTNIQKISYVLSTITIIGTIIYMILKHRKQEKN